ncbi:MAG TPA: SPFH domain-containing protein, partial [Deltaproteobacteria bacterium]|nr:SPFH domain-containing protein [Deltaproteobacteria bacterium]
MNDHDIYTVQEAMQTAVKKGPLRGALIAGAILLVLLFSHPWVLVGAGERGVVLNFGAVQKKVLGEGLHFRIPIMQTVVL